MHNVSSGVFKFNNIVIRMENKTAYAKCWAYNTHIYSHKFEQLMS